MTIAHQGTNNSPAAVKDHQALDIVVLAGGPSAERAVSLNSGKAVCEALKKLGHRAAMRDISADDLSALDGSIDFAFIALHGEFGEDGEVQTELERRGIPYSGSGPQASRVAMNKVVAKQHFRARDIPTPLGMHVRPENLADLENEIKPPAVVKPVASGSSVDTSMVHDAAALRAAAADVVGKYGEALVEQLIEGPELTCAILGDTPLPVCEIRPAREFYDYIAKYEADDTGYVFGETAPDLEKMVQRVSLDAHRALGCEVFSRVDIMLDADRRPYVLEINTIPGFTSHSLVPKAAARVGISFEQLCQRIIDLSLATRPSSVKRA